VDSLSRSAREAGERIFSEKYAKIRDAQTLENPTLEREREREREREGRGRGRGTKRQQAEKPGGKGGTGRRGK